MQQLFPHVALFCFDIYLNVSKFTHCHACFISFSQIFYRLLPTISIYIQMVVFSNSSGCHAKVVIFKLMCQIAVELKSVQNMDSDSSIGNNFLSILCSALMLSSFSSGLQVCLARHVCTVYTQPNISVRMHSL